MINNQKGAVPVLILIAALGLVAFLVVSSSASFKDKLFAQLFPKRSSYALSEPISGPISPSPTPTPDTVAPTVSITSPLNGATVRKNSTVTIQATASDNVAVSKVEFYVAGSLICTDTISSYSCSWRVPKQPRVTYSITATAYDTSGNTAKNSISVSSK